MSIVLTSQLALSPVPAVDPQSHSQTSPQTSAGEARQGNGRFSGSINCIFTTPFQQDAGPVALPHCP